MRTTHVCWKTYFVRDRLGTTRSITTRAHITPGLKHDLLSGKALNRAGYQVILDADNDIAGVCAVEKGHIDIEKSFPFMNELSSLYYLIIERMSATEFSKMSGWELWHRRLAHSSVRNIRESISHTNGMEELLSRKHENHLKCPACMIEKKLLSIIHRRKPQQRNR